MNMNKASVIHKTNLGGGLWMGVSLDIPYLSGNIPGMLICCALGVLGYGQPVQATARVC